MHRLRCVGLLLELLLSAVILTAGFPILLAVGSAAAAAFFVSMVVAGTFLAAFTILTTVCRKAGFDSVLRYSARRTDAAKQCRDATEWFCGVLSCEICVYGRQRACCFGAMVVRVYVVTRLQCYVCNHSANAVRRATCMQVHAAAEPHCCPCRCCLSRWALVAWALS